MLWFYTVIYYHYCYWIQFEISIKQEYHSNEINYSKEELYTSLLHKEYTDTTFGLILNFCIKKKPAKLASLLYLKIKLLNFNSIRTKLILS